MSIIHRFAKASVAVWLVSMGLLLATAAHAANTTYYVDAVIGSDSAAGTSPTAAWRTLAKVNATTFGGGDQILFHVGQTWMGQVHPLGSGVAGNPITIASYGGSGMPKIDGHSLSNGGTVYLDGQSYWTISGLEVTSNSGVSNFGSTLIPGSSRTGILVRNVRAGLVSGITITGNYVHDVNGCFFCIDVDGHGNGGIAVLVPDWWQVTDSFADVLIANNTVENIGRTGIIFWDNSTGINTSVLLPDWLSRNVRITGNSVKTVDSDGIMAWGAQGVQMDHNVVGNAGLRTINLSPEPSAAGLWPTRTINAVVEYNEVYGTRTQQNVDGQGYDVDADCINTLVQYNYSHDNEGGFILMESFASVSHDLTVRYNLSVNDSWGGVKGVFTFALGVLPNTNIYNNTVYVPAGSPAKITFCDQCDGSSTGAWSFKNNIVANLGAGTYLYPNVVGAVIDHNLFYGNHPASEPPDAYKITADPLFVSAGGTAPIGIGNVGGYTLQTGSPAIGSGVLINSNGGRDYFGDPVSATLAPTRGFYEPPR